MKTLCYNLDNTIPCGMALGTISMKIPCFISWHSAINVRHDAILEVTIQCREADTAYVEKMLAEFV